MRPARRSRDGRIIWNPCFKIPPLQFARAFCYNLLVRLRGGKTAAMPGVRFPAWLGRRIVANRRVWDASRESVRNYHKKTYQEDTAVRAVSPPSVYPQRFSQAPLTMHRRRCLFSRTCFRCLTNREKHVALSAPRVSTCRQRGAGEMRHIDEAPVEACG